ncbi:hypothetical protein [Vibrio sonorensis]|uniref:hypothetical protein n=1 Tax=Vibrio sonorensis TaxID=1004316 RepID=UPI0009FE8EE5|nr:hypothetical protein [Vibrio sonorensis]
MNDSNLTAQEALKMAREASAVAKELNDNTREQIAATRHMHDEMLRNQRRISFAMCKLLPKQVADNIVLSNGSVIGFVDTGSAADDLVGMDNNIALAMKNREAYDIIHAINVLAMANTDMVHVFTEFAPHINQFCVNVYGVSQDYISNPSIKPLIKELVFLADNEALEKLLSIESQLTELIIEAREEAEAKAEVEA